MKAAWRNLGARQRALLARLDVGCARRHHSERVLRLSLGWEPWRMRRLVASLEARGLVHRYAGRLYLTPLGYDYLESME